MAGFMPLKAELSLKDTFSIPDLSKLSTQVIDETSRSSFIDVGMTSNSSKCISSMKRACMLFLRGVILIQRSLCTYIVDYLSIHERPSSPVNRAYLHVCFIAALHQFYIVYILQQLREQCVLRILEMARLYKDLCDIIYAIPNVNFTTKCDAATMRFSLAEKDTPPDMNTTASPSTKVATSRDDEMTEDSNGRHSDGNTVANLNNSKDHKEDAGDLDGVSSGGEDMEGGYESDTSGSSSSSSSGGEDVVVEGYGDSGEEEEEGERLTEEGEEEALVTASIQQLKVSSKVVQTHMY